LSTLLKKICNMYKNEQKDMVNKSPEAYATSLIKENDRITNDQKEAIRIFIEQALSNKDIEHIFTPMFSMENSGIMYGHPECIFKNTPMLAIAIDITGNYYCLGQDLDYIFYSHDQISVDPFRQERLMKDLHQIFQDEILEHPHLDPEWKPLFLKDSQ